MRKPGCGVILVIYVERGLTGLVFICVVSGVELLVSVVLLVTGIGSSLMLTPLVLHVSELRRIIRRTTHKQNLKG